MGVMQNVALMDELHANREDVPRTGLPEGIDAESVEAISRTDAPRRDWPSAVNELYREESVERLFREGRFLLLVGMITCFISVLIDMILEPSIALEGALLRVLIVGPLTALGIYASASGRARMLAVIIGIAPISFIMILVHLSSHMPAEIEARYLTATILILGIANITLPFTIRGLLIFDIGATVAFGAMMLVSDLSAFLYHADSVVIFILVSGGTLPIAARIDRLRKRNFLLGLRTRIVSDELVNANTALRTLSETDPLTGICNRRAFERVFNDTIATPSIAIDEASFASGTRNPAGGGSIVLMMIDLDHFKTFNDRHGHQAGDQCLTIVARTLQDIFKEVGGIVARYGGEEFIAALCVSGRSRATDIADEVRRSIASLLMPVSETGRSVITASVGLAITSKTGPLSCEDLIETADTALYRAKENGRNRLETIEVTQPLSRATYHNNNPRARVSARVGEHDTVLARLDNDAGIIAKR